MGADTRPSVTVTGHLTLDGNVWVIDLDEHPGLDLDEGDEVEVTIRKHAPHPESSHASRREE